MGYKTYDCSVRRQCGGCEWLAVPYPLQLKRKQEALEELFQDLPGDVSPAPILGMEDPTRCRCKIIVPFAPAKGGKVRYGLYAKGSHRVISRDDCLIEDPKATPILDTLAKLAGDFKLQPYDEDTGEGFLRHALLRIGASSGQVLVCLVCTRDQFPGSKTFIKQLRHRHPEVATVVLNVNKRITNVVLGEKERVLYGPGFIEDELCGCSFRISASSFYQVNPRQTQVLYSTAVEMAGLTGSETILDAYCGTGTIGIIASRQAGQLIGVERSAQSVKDARSNARRNGVENARFIAADASEYLEELVAEGGQGQVDVVFMDPPRSGSDARFLKALCAVGPKRVVYISCEPKTQVRDLKQLLAGGYRLETVQPVDMFPHTPHVECVASMVRA